MLIGGITDPALAALPSRPVTLYRSSDGHIPDWNDAIGYPAPWGLDRLIVNPHTGSQIVVAGRHVWILNPNLRLGVRDAIRVIKQLVTTTFEADSAFVMHAAAFAVDSRTMVVGWTDPLRVIDASPEAPKRMIPLIQYAHNDRSQVTEQPLPLVAVVVPDVRPGLSPLACDDLDDATGDVAVRTETLPQRVRWLGVEPAARPPAAALMAPRYLRISYAYQDAHLTAAALRATLPGCGRPIR